MILVVCILHDCTVWPSTTITATIILSAIQYPLSPTIVICTYVYQYITNYSYVRYRGLLARTRCTVRRSFEQSVDRIKAVDATRYHDTRQPRSGRCCTYALMYWRVVIVGVVILWRRRSRTAFFASHFITSHFITAHFITSHHITSHHIRLLSVVPYTHWSLYRTCSALAKYCSLTSL